MAWPVLGAVAGGAGGAAGGAGIWALLKNLMGGMGGMGGAGGAGGAASTSQLGPTPQTMGFMENGQLIPQSFSAKTGQLGPTPGQLGPSAGPNSGQAQAGQSAQAKMGLNQKFNNLQSKVNGVFDSARAFGQALGGLDKTPLNNIPRNTPPIILPQNNQNPGNIAMAALMARIAGLG